MDSPTTRPWTENDDGVAEWLQCQDGLECHEMADEEAMTEELYPETFFMTPKGAK